MTARLVFYLHLNEVGVAGSIEASFQVHDVGTSRGAILGTGRHSHAAEESLSVVT